MTVSELIEELKKMPQHHPVVLATPSPLENGGGFDIDYHFAERVDGLSGSAGAFVVIEGKA